jgi:phospholipase C
VIRLNPGQSQVRHLPLRSGRYDISITSDLDPDYLHHLAGNVEPGFSQP